MKHRAGLILFAVLAAATLLGGLEWFERALMDLRFRLVQRDATDRLIVVEIDQRSLRALNVWPWPRTYHAEIVDRLVAAGADTIAIDVDFSAHSQAQADDAFEEALARAGRKVILPAFKQRLVPHQDAPTVAETKPLERFARHVTLASIVFQPDNDSRIRHAENLHKMAEGDVPSLPVLLGSDGQAAPPEFYIDYGIRMQTIPRISYVDVLRGEFPPGLFQGRHVLIGATAVELGDQLAVPLHVSVPGTIMLALATDSLRQGRALQRSGPWPALAVALLLMVALTPGMSGAWGRGVVIAAVGSTSIIGLAVVVQAVWPLSLDTAPALLAPWLTCLMGLVGAIERQALRLFRQRMEIQQRSMIMRQIVENSFDAIVVIGHTGRVVMHNQAAGRLIGADAAGLHERPIESLFRLTPSEDGPSTTLGALLAQEDTPARLLEGVAVTRAGDEVPIELSLRRMVVHPTASPFERRTEPRAYHFVTARDVSERRRTVAALRTALQQAEAASRAKSQFLATISHELRTPLNAIIGFSEMIKDQMMGAIGDVRYCDYAKDIQSSGRHLLHVINDILDVTRVESGEVRVEDSEIEVKDAFDAAIRLVGGQMTKHRIALVRQFGPELPALRADDRLLKQVLVNLLSNAAKFTPEDGTVTVGARLRDNGGLSLSVADTGIGIPAAEIPKLGRPFYQVDQSHTRQFGGAGLGLSIVRGLVELHGGRLAIDSKVGAGTTFTCHFPPERTVPRKQVAA
ncbi:MAG: CHASE2 domain-containing protein [Alphaproteobacteria bacterium]|nr:CHASE2 domain-containing protein [Alphaproteobacteria bacterium]